MSFEHRHFRPVAALLIACLPSVASAQDVWAGVNALHQLKTAFVDALRGFAEAAAGSYGDEGPQLASELEGAQRALDAWDRAMAAYEAAARTAAPSSDRHAALGAVYLDRSRISDALTEFAAATRLDARRADVHTMGAMAYELAGDSRNTLAEREKAAALSPRDIAAQYLAAARRADEDSPAARESQRRVDAEHLSMGGTAPIQFDRVGLLRQLPGVAPIFPPERYVAGFRLLERGRFAEGLRALRQAAGSDPLAAGANTNAAATAGARLRRGQLQAALSELRAAPSRDSEVERVRGVAYWADEQDANSIDAFTSAMRINGGDERARVALADVLRGAGRTDEAGRLLNDTIALLPDSGQAHYRLAQLLQSQARVAAAAAEFERAVRCSPLTGLDYLYDTLGGLYAAQADLDRAVAAYRGRVGASPNNADAHRKLGEIYALQGRLEAALSEFDVAQRLDPRMAEAFAEAGQIYLRLNRFADAIRVSRQALALDATQQKARFTLGTALARLGERAEGQHELDAFQRDVDEAAAVRRRVLEANTLERDAARAEDAGDYARAAALLQRALGVSSPDNTRLEIKLAKLFVAAGQPSDALQQLAQAAQSDDRAEIHEIAAQAYTALGQTDARAREETRFRQLVEQRKEERLKTQPLLR